MHLVGSTWQVPYEEAWQVVRCGPLRPALEVIPSHGKEEEVERVFREELLRLGQWKRDEGVVCWHRNLVHLIQARVGISRGGAHSGEPTISTVSF